MSFKVSISVRLTPTASAGRASGSATRKNTVRRPCPSVRALSLLLDWLEARPRDEAKRTGYTIVDLPTYLAHASELSRWMGGLAVDRVVPLESFLLTGELVARRPMAESANVAWDVAAGTRYQLDPRIALDAGAGYRLTGEENGWFVTFGAALSLGLPWRAR